MYAGFSPTFLLVEWNSQKTTAMNKELQIMAAQAPHSDALYIHQVVSRLKTKKPTYEYRNTLKLLLKNTVSLEISFSRISRGTSAKKIKKLKSPIPGQEKANNSPLKMESVRNLRFFMESAPTKIVN